MTLTIARQMFSAEVLKLRRNRSLIAFALLLSVLTVLLFFGYNAVQHASNPAQYLPAGGTHAFERAVRVLGLFFGALAAILIGTEAGTADLASGVFRDLVATGRSRLALFAVRAPAAIAVTLTCTGIGFGLSLVATFALAGGSPTPSLGLILQAAGWVVLSNVVMVALAVGVGSLTGSRAVTLTAVIGWQTVATQILINVSGLGDGRDALLTPALAQLNPFSSKFSGITMATGVAVVVAACWAIVPSVVGAWKTKTRDA
jgi:ABC-type transport system involved in multi-copper enzyme maturation permease subunit